MKNRHVERGKLGMIVAKVLFGERALEPLRDEEWYGPVDFRRVVLPAYGIVNVEVKTFDAYWFSGHDRFGPMTGICEEDFREYQELQREGRITVLAFVDPAIRQMVWASVAELANPGAYGELVRGVLIQRKSVPVRLFNPNARCYQKLWPLRWFKNRAPIPDKYLPPLWRTHDPDLPPGKAEIGMEHEKFARWNSYLDDVDRLAGQMALSLFS